jgi:UDP-N-acetylglucosamine 2-epimerase (non-hydrolysing)
MIICFIGTRAQLIKMAPILREMEERGLPLHMVMTGQHKETMDMLLHDFGVRTAPVVLYDGKEVTGLVQMGLWLLSSLWRSLHRADTFLPRSAGRNDVVVVHGDTMSTLLGALAGKLRGMKVAHVEAGLRSRNLLHPFPEELTRLAVSRLAGIAFCPGRWASANLAPGSATIVNTGQNTLADALGLALQARPARPAGIGGEAFGIASIHRFENIYTKARLAEIISMIEEAAAKYRMVFVLHPATRKRAARFGLLERLERNPRLTILPRMGYVDFVGLMRDARFVITDGGGNQEELSYLGKPTLLMRKATERPEGIGTTATLCNFDRAILHAFLDRLDAEPAIAPAPAPPQSPSKIIADHLARYA